MKTRLFRNAGILSAAVLAAVIAATVAVRSAGLFPGLPIFGAGSYCGGSVIAGVPGTAAVCSNTVPAGPTTFAGTEVFPVDIVPGNAVQSGAPETMSLSVLAMGAGPTVTNTVAGAQTIPNNTPNWVENVGNTSATFTAPSAPQGGQVQRVIIQTAQTTSWIFGANAGQSCIPACPFSNTNVAAGSVSAWQWYPATSTWVKIQ